MKWHWKIRIYNSRGHYAIGQIALDKKLELIDSFQDTYEAMTGCRCLLEGMSERPHEGVEELVVAFKAIWGFKP